MKKGRFLIPLEKKGRHEKVWKRKKGVKLRNQRKGIRESIALNNTRDSSWLGFKTKEEGEVYEYPTLADLWRRTQVNVSMEKYGVPQVEGRLYALDESFFYLQSGLKKDVALRKDRYYIPVENPMWFCLNGLDIQMSCRKEIMGSYRFRKWFLANRYFRKKVSRLALYYRASLWKKYQDLRIREESPRYICRVLAGGILIHWKQLEGRVSSRSDWEVDYPLYIQKKEFIKEVLRRDSVVLVPRDLPRGKKLRVWSHAQFFLKRPSFYYRNEKFFFRKKIRWTRKPSLVWRKGSSSTFLIFLKTGMLEKRDYLVFKKVPLRLKAFTYWKKGRICRS